jgi:hypothetical protein
MDEFLGHTNDQLQKARDIIKWNKKLSKKIKRFNQRVV